MGFLPYNIQGDWTINSKGTKMKDNFIYISGTGKGCVLEYLMQIHIQISGFLVFLTPHWHPLPFTLSNVETTLNLTIQNWTILFPCVTTVSFITFIWIEVQFLYCKFVINQILFKQVSFQSELSTSETLGKLNSCSCGSISQQLSYRQKGLRSTGHNWIKNMQLILGKDWCWDT